MKKSTKALLKIAMFIFQYVLCICIIFSSFIFITSVEEIPLIGRLIFDIVLTILGIPAVFDMTLITISEIKIYINQYKYFK